MRQALALALLLAGCAPADTDVPANVLCAGGRLTQSAAVLEGALPADCAPVACAPAEQRCLEGADAVCFEALDEVLAEGGDCIDFHATWTGWCRAGCY